MDIENDETIEEPVEPLLRFELDLEFLQCQTNPEYIECENFINHSNVFCKV